MKKIREEAVKQVKRIAKPRPQFSEKREIQIYNKKVMGWQNYYSMASHISIDFRSLQMAVMTVLINRLKMQKGNRITRTGRTLTKAEVKRYGKSKMLRYVVGSGEPIYHIGYVRCRSPMNKRRQTCRYTPEGRAEVHDELRINTKLMLQFAMQPNRGKSIEYADNRVSLFSGQNGKCQVTGREFKFIGEIHCHHKLPRKLGGDDKYENLMLVLERSTQAHKRNTR